MKTKIAVLAGGNSAERDVSWASGCKISNALADSGYAVALIDVWLGVELNGKKAGELFLARPEYQDHAYQVPRTPPNLKELNSRRSPNCVGYFGPNVLDVCRSADVVFIALHGAAGENGQLQATLGLLDIPFTGSDFAGCVVAMDKHLAKRQMRSVGQPTADWLYYQRSEDIDISLVLEKIGFPCAVKPPRGGSSIGISLPQNESEFRIAVQEAVSADRSGSDGDILIEKYIQGREFCVGILDGKALPPIEIIPHYGWFDYESKYQSERTKEVCPAEIPDELTVALQAAALAIHKALHLGFYSRIDFKVEEDGAYYCLEANTLPGMTPTSLLPQEAAAAEIPYQQLCDMIAKDALNRRTEKSLYLN